jgi:predicted MarR family transcription regulator
MTGLIEGDHTSAQASYDLRRLRLKGLIERIGASNTYRLTPDGIRFAIGYTKICNKLLRPLLAADQPPAPLPIRQALRTIEATLDDYLHEARIRPAA